MSAVWVAIMAVGLVGMIVCSKKQRTNPALQPVSFVLFVVVLIGAFMWLRSSNILPGSGAKGIVGNELAFQRARGEVAGELMAKVAPGKKVLVIAEPNFEKDQFVAAMLESFKKAYGGDALEIDTVDLPANAEEEGTPIAELMTAKAVKAVIAKHADAGVILFTSGLPENPTQLGLLSQKDHPAVFLFSRGQASNKYLSEQIKSGNIAGIIIGKPGVKYSTKASGNAKEAFDIRYLLITKDNFDANQERFK